MANQLPQNQNPGEASFVNIYQPADEAQVMLIELLLEREGVIYYVMNKLGNNGTRLPAHGFCVMVQHDRAAEMRRLLQEELDFK